MAEIEKSRVLHLTDVLQFQPGAVVSRTLINQKAGTITLFAFAKDEELSEHTAPYDASQPTTCIKSHYIIKNALGDD